MKLSLFAAFIIFIFSCSTSEKVTEQNFADFFRNNSSPSYSTLIENFGEPTFRTPLFIGETEEDIRDDHAWLNYKLDDKKSIQITCSNGEVGSAFINIEQSLTPLN